MQAKFDNSNIYSYLAQLAEHLTVNQVVAGSSPAVGAKTKGHQIGVLLFWVLTEVENQC